MGKTKAILPRRLVSNPRAMAHVITNTMNGVAQSIKVDFEVTAQTWDEPASFSIETRGPWERVIGTTDDIYTMLNEGTRAHRILPKNGQVLQFRTPFRAKTRPNSISSSAGSVGTTSVYRRGVNHPGTEARNWDKAIAKKWRRLVRGIFQRAIDSAVER